MPMSPLSEQIKVFTARAKGVHHLDAIAADQLPLWPEPVRGLPNPLARSALFSVGNKKSERKHFKKHPIASLRGINLHYTGEELRQDDEDVFLQLLHLARVQPLGECVEFTAHAMLKALGWNGSSKSYERLRACIDRLSATSLTITAEQGRKGYAGSLVRKFAWKDDEGTNLSRWKIWFEKEIVALFGPDTYTQVLWEQRLQLPPMAKWLHAFYITHKEPLPFKVENLHKLCGSDSKTLYHFRPKLKSSLDELVKCGFLNHYHIDKHTDTVHVTRSPRRQ